MKCGTAYLVTRGEPGCIESRFVYVYDEIGNLIQVRLPDGRVIDYIIDGQNRRADRKVDGMVTHRWFYGDQLRIAAEIGSDGQITSRFVYGARGNVPDSMVKDGVTCRIISIDLGSAKIGGEYFDRRSGTADRIRRGRPTTARICG